MSCLFSIQFCELNDTLSPLLPADITNAPSMIAAFYSTVSLIKGAYRNEIYRQQPLSVA